MADRNPSKQKRAAQNKAARQEREARRAKAAASGRAESPDTSSKGSSSKGARSTGTRRDGTQAKAGATSPARTASGRPSRQAPTRPVREPTNPVTRFLANLRLLPGGQATFFAFVLAIVAAGTLLFTPSTPQPVLRDATLMINEVRDVAGLDQAVGTDTEYPAVTVTQALGGVGVAIALVPVLIAGVALAFSQRPNRRRVLTICAFMMALVVIQLLPISLFFLFSMGALIYGAWQIRRVEGPVPPRPRRSRKAAQEDADADGADGDDVG